MKLLNQKKKTMKKNKKITSLTWGLHGIKDFKILIKRIIYTLKHGYTPIVMIESYEYFLQMWKEVLIKYRKERYFHSESEYDTLLDKMITNIEIMQINPAYFNTSEEVKEVQKKIDEAKQEFFEDFKEIFYDLWDFGV